MCLFIGGLFISHIIIWWYSNILKVHYVVHYKHVSCKIIFGIFLMNCQIFDFIVIFNEFNVYVLDVRVSIGSNPTRFENWKREKLKPRIEPKIYISKPKLNRITRFGLVFGFRTEETDKNRNKYIKPKPNQKRSFRFGFGRFVSSDLFSDGFVQP